jgi:hypothetical protein
LGVHSPICRKRALYLGDALHSADGDPRAVAQVSRTGKWLLNACSALRALLAARDQRTA